MATSLAPAGESARATSASKHTQRTGGNAAARRAEKAAQHHALEEKFLADFSGNSESDDTLLVGILTGQPMHCRVPREAREETRLAYFSAIRRHLTQKYRLRRSAHGIGQLTAAYRNGSGGPGEVRTMLSDILTTIAKRSQA